MIKKMAQSIVNLYISKNKIETEKKEIYEYSFEILIASIINLIVVIIISILSKQIVQGILFTICFVSMRSFAGGYHANNHLGCILTLTIIYSIYTLIYKFAPNIILFYLSISMLVVSIIIPFLSPVESINKTLSLDEYRKNKKITIIIYIIFVCIDITFIIVSKTQKLAFSLSFPLFITSLLLVLGKLNNLKYYK